jgi:DNA-binding response OmpR family regulator
MSAHILVVEDEAKLAQFIQMELTQEGYQVTVAEDGISGLTAAREHQLDLIILDWMLPGLSGLEVCHRLRTTGDKVPVILLTAKDDVRDRVAGLDAGADDYVVKPFSIEELLARVRAHLRRTNEEDADSLQLETNALLNSPPKNLTYWCTSCATPAKSSPAIASWKKCGATTLWVTPILLKSIFAISASNLKKIKIND